MGAPAGFVPALKCTCCPCDAADMVKPTIAASAVKTVFNDIVFSFRWVPIDEVMYPTGHITPRAPNVRLQARGACAASLCKPLLGTRRASKKPAHQKKQQRRREDRDVCIHAQNGWDSALVAQRATIEGDCEGAEPEATKNA